MLTDRAIIEVFGRFTAAGVKAPDAWLSSSPEAARAAQRATVQVWRESLSGRVDDAGLRATASVWLAGADSRWWPTPGQVLRLAPRPEPVQRLLTDAADEPCPLHAQGLDAVDEAIHAGVPAACCAGCCSERACWPGMGAARAAKDRAA